MQSIVTKSGQIWRVVGGLNVGVREVADHVWLISFMHYDLGFFYDTGNRVECASQSLQC